MMTLRNALLKQFAGAAICDLADCNSARFRVVGWGFESGRGMASSILSV